MRPWARLAAWVWRAWGQCCLLAGQQRAAKVAFWRGLHAGGQGQARAQASLAHLCAQQGSLVAALRWQRRALAVAPDTAAHHYNLGYLLEQRGDWHAAQQAFEAALALAPRLDQAWYGLGRALAAQGRLEEALAAQAENTRLQPLSPYGWSELAVLQWTLGQAEAAHRTVEHLAGFEPRAALALRQRLVALEGRA